MNSNDEFLYIVYDILNSDEFNKLNGIKHHGLNRYDHSYRVSYYSYLIAKKLKLDYESVARGGLLHDFFLENNEDTSIKNKIINIINHPKYALENSSKYFELNKIEKNIIESHMFPVRKTLPLYIESWLVDIVDDCVSIYERIYGIRKHLSLASNFLFLLIVNCFK